MGKSVDRYKSDLNSLIKSFLFLGFCWSTVIFLFSGFEIFHIQSHAFNDAEIKARSTFAKDTLYRIWATNHGGVYVPETEQTPPNPYLSHILDRDITTDSGKKLTLVNPAYMTRQVHELSENGYGFKGHITSLNPLRPQNKPDDWETQVLKEFERGVPEAVSREYINGAPYLRFMRPFITKKGCLKCHASQGYNEGDIRGGISVSVPLDSYLAKAKIDSQKTLFSYTSIWLLGLAGIFISYRNHKKSFLTEQKLLKSLDFRNRQLQGIVYSASHDLKSPLVNISGFSDMLIESCRQLKNILNKQNIDEKDIKELKSLADTEIPDSLNFISASTAKINSLIEGLLEVSRVGTSQAKFEKLDMNNILKDIIKEMQFSLDDNDVRLKIDFLPDCLGDKTMINRLFSNLIDNAIKYRDPQKVSHIRISGTIKGSDCVYCLEDNGIGIGQDYQSKIFELFHRLNPDDKKGGEGIGLCIVLRILDQNHGSIRLESEEGKGTKFFISLPKA